MDQSLPRDSGRVHFESIFHANYGHAADIQSAGTQYRHPFGLFFVISRLQRSAPAGQACSCLPSWRRRNGAGLG